MNGCCIFLCENVDYDTIHLHVIQKDILSRDVVDAISKEKGNVQQMDKFLTKFLRTDLVETYPKFLNILQEKKMPHVLEVLGEPSTEAGKFEHYSIICLFLFPYNVCGPVNFSMMVILHDLKIFCKPKMYCNALDIYI